MIWALLLMWNSANNVPGNMQLIEGFNSYKDCDAAYQEILKKKPTFKFGNLTGVCMQVKDVR